MSDLFRARAGTLIRSTVSSPRFITVDGLDEMLRGGKMLGTSFRLDRGQDVLPLKTLNNLYYLYAFGESPGKILIGGLIFFSNCLSTSDQSQVIKDLNSYYKGNNAFTKPTPTRITVSSSSDSSNVIGDLNSYYEHHNAYAKSTPTRIAVGGASFRTLLTSFSIAADMNPYNYATFSLGFMLIPYNKPSGNKPDDKAGLQTSSLQTSSLQTSSGLQTSSL